MFGTRSHEQNTLLSRLLLSCLFSLRVKVPHTRSPQIRMISFQLFNVYIGYSNKDKYSQSVETEFGFLGILRNAFHLESNPYFWGFFFAIFLNWISNILSSRYKQLGELWALPLVHLQVSWQPASISCSVWRAVPYRKLKWVSQPIWCHSQALCTKWALDSFGGWVFAGLY